MPGGKDDVPPIIAPTLALSAAFTCSRGFVGSIVAPFSQHLQLRWPDSRESIVRFVRIA